MKKSKFINYFSSELNLETKEIDRLIKEFSLSSRAKYVNPPLGFETNDIWPWIYNRRLSYIRRPIILIEKNKTTYLVWGARNSYSSIEQLNRLIISTRYKISQSSDEMKSFIGKLVNIRGKYFEKVVYEWVVTNYPNNKNLINEPIAPSKTFNSAVDLGDIDVFTINVETGVIYSLECKNINMGRSPREISNAMKRFIGDKPDDASWADKHAKREKWLINNSEFIMKRFNLKEKPQLNSLIVISEEIPSAFLEGFNYNNISFSRLQSEMLDFSRKIN